MFRLDYLTRPPYRFLFEIASKHLPRTGQTRGPDPDLFTGSEDKESQLAAAARNATRRPSARSQLVFLSAMAPRIENCTELDPSVSYLTYFATPPVTP
jgi:hypothetical protein